MFLEEYCKNVCNVCCCLKQIQDRDWILHKRSPAIFIICSSSFDMNFKLQMSETVIPEAQNLFWILQSFHVCCQGLLALFVVNMLRNSFFETLLIEFVLSLLIC